MSVNPIDWLADILLRWRNKEATEISAYDDEARRAVFSLPADQARLRAEAILEDPRKFLVERGVIPAPAEVETLAPSIRAFFNVYSSAKHVFGDARIDRSRVGPSALAAGHFRIGDDMEFAEIVVRPGDDALYEAANGEAPSFEAPSIFHWFVLLDVLHSGPENS